MGCQNSEHLGLKQGRSREISISTPDVTQPIMQTHVRSCTYIYIIIYIYIYTHIHTCYVNISVFDPYSSGSLPQFQSSNRVGISRRILRITSQVIADCMVSERDFFKDSPMKGAYQSYYHHLPWIPLSNIFPTAVNWVI